MAETFNPCSHQAHNTCIKSVAVLIHDGVEVACRKFTDKGRYVDMARLESGLSFLWVKVSMTMSKKFQQVKVQY